MKERSLGSVVSLGVGRKDYSLLVERSVSPIMRSHQTRSIWTAYATMDTVAYPNAYGATLGFWVGDTLVDYVLAQEDGKPVRYVLHDIEVSGNRDAATVAGLYKFSYPDYSFVEAICQVFGQRSASVHLAKGHVMEPGRVYYVVYAQYSEFSDFTYSLTVTAIKDRIAGE
jgi:hypothetical protein